MAKVATLLFVVIISLCCLYFCESAEDVKCSIVNKRKKTNHRKCFQVCLKSKRPRCVKCDKKAGTCTQFKKSRKKPSTTKMPSSSQKELSTLLELITHTMEPTVAMATTKATTLLSTTESTIVMDTTETTTLMVTSEPTTELTTLLATTEPTTLLATTEPTTLLATTERTTLMDTTKPSTLMHAAEESTVTATTKSNLPTDTGIIMTAIKESSMASTPEQPRPTTQPETKHMVDSIDLITGVLSEMVTSESSTKMLTPMLETDNDAMMNFTSANISDSDVLDGEVTSIADGLSVSHDKQLTDTEHLDTTRVFPVSSVPDILTSSTETGFSDSEALDTTKGPIMASMPVSVKETSLISKEVTRNTKTSAATTESSQSFSSTETDLEMTEGTTNTVEALLNDDKEPKTKATKTSSTSNVNNILMYVIYSLVGTLGVVVIATLLYLAFNVHQRRQRQKKWRTSQQTGTLISAVTPKLATVSMAGDYINTNNNKNGGSDGVGKPTKSRLDDTPGAVQYVDDVDNSPGKAKVTTFKPGKSHSDEQQRPTDNMTMTALATAENSSVTSADTLEEQ